MSSAGFYGERGFGFIRRDDGGDDVFFHITSCDAVTVNEGDRVEFEITAGRQPGKFAAASVKVLTVA